MLKCFNLETKANDVINLTDDIKQFVAEVLAKFFQKVFLISYYGKVSEMPNK